LPSRIGEWLSNTIDRVIEFGINLGSKAAEAGSDMVKNIIDAVKGLPSQFLDIGINVVKGIWEGITSMGSWIGERVSGFFKGIVGGARAALDINSPSRVFRDQVGKYMAQGVGVGFTDETDNIKKSMEKDLSDLVYGMQMAVDYNVSSTTGGIIARNNQGTSTISSNLNSDDIQEDSTFIVPVYMDSEKISEYTYKKVDGKFALAGKRVR